MRSNDSASWLSTLTSSCNSARYISLKLVISMCCPFACSRCPELGGSSPLSAVQPKVRCCPATQPASRYSHATRVRSAGSIGFSAGCGPDPHRADGVRVRQWEEAPIQAPYYGISLRIARNAAAEHSRGQVTGSGEALLLWSSSLHIAARAVRELLH